MMTEFYPSVSLKQRSRILTTSSAKFFSINNALFNTRLQEVQNQYLENEITAQPSSAMGSEQKYWSGVAEL